MLFEIPIGRKVLLYTRPISMRWGDKKLSKLCKEELDKDPDEQKEVFVFTNKKKDQIAVFYVDNNGPTMFLKLLNDTTFIFPVPETVEQIALEISGKLLLKLLR